MPTIGLVLSGGGARGAYEAGVLAGIAELLDTKKRTGALFDVITGTSVGALNAVLLAAYADRPALGVAHLVDRWTSLRLEKHLRPRLRSLVGRSLAARRPSVAEGIEGEPSWGRALLDARPFEVMAHRDVPWIRVHENIRRGNLSALIVSALNVANGRTVSFAELAPGVEYVPSPNPTRASVVQQIQPAHVLASAAIPMLFPARRVGESYFCDGGIRFNTPMSPAIRVGADRLLVIALRSRHPGRTEQQVLEAYPNPIFLLGKVLDALLLDPVEYDLQVLERFNRMLEVLSDTAPPAALARVAEVLKADRGVPHRRIETLVFRPSVDIGVLALEHFKRRRTSLCSGTATTLLLENAAALGAHIQADFLSYIYFDEAFARALIAQGRRDVMDRAAEVDAFFRSVDVRDLP